MELSELVGLDQFEDEVGVEGRRAGQGKALSVVLAHDLVAAVLLVHQFAAGL